ncbi:hypothetical protein K8R33_00495 [archaeon]|nr:hypothetical protein [archaeon]
MDEYKEGEFNITTELLRRCAKLLECANESKINRDYRRWRESLETLLNSISFILTWEELEDFSNKLVRLEGEMDMLGSYYGNHSNMESNIKSKLNKLERRFVKIMYEHGLYYPKPRKENKRIIE